MPLEYCLEQVPHSGGNGIALFISLSLSISELWPLPSHFGETNGRPCMPHLRWSFPGSPETCVLFLVSFREPKQLRSQRSTKGVIQPGSPCAIPFGNMDKLNVPRKPIRAQKRKRRYRSPRVHTPGMAVSCTTPRTQASEALARRKQLQKNLVL